MYITMMCICTAEHKGTEAKSVLEQSLEKIYTLYRVQHRDVQHFYYLYVKFATKFIHCILIKR